MDLGLREWMVLIGGLLILAVIVDGLRRMQKARKNTVKLSKRASKWNFDDNTDEMKISELPGGAARVLEREQIAREAQMQQDHNDESSAPILMTPVRSFETIEGGPEQEPAQEEMVLDTVADPEPALRVEPVIEEEFEAPSFKAERDPEIELVKTVDPRLEEVFVINVISKSKDGFSGAKLLEILLACDVRYGDMDIFHRSESKKDGGQHQFSVANLVEPGTFNLDGMRHMKTPGVAFFMRLPGPSNAMNAFDAMVETAECIVRNLGGEMRDQNKSVMTKQTVAHDKERVREFERRLLAQR
ncbi:MAG: cell division protein ZipA [Pseudomonadales bacterium]|jgi:cell division protein ZipA